MSPKTRCKLRTSAGFTIWELLILCSAFGVLVALAVSCGACSNTHDTSSQVTPNIGDTVLLMSPDGKLILGATSLSAYQTILKSVDAKDNEGIIELISAGMAFEIQSGTIARYLDNDASDLRIVRILDGPNQGKKAWIFEKLVHGIQREAEPYAPSNPQDTTDPTSKFLAPSQGSDSAKAFVRRNWDAILTTCPGLVTYAKDLTWGGIDDRGDPSYQANVRGIGIRLIVIDRPTSIPVDFKAFGQHCSFRVTPDEQHLILEKTSCTEVCLEHSIPRLQENLILPLRHRINP